jgi:MYXO-CTERM domain-containing protein
MVVGRPGAPHPGNIRGLIRFNIVNPTPRFTDRLTVTSATLTLTLQKMPNGGAGTAATYTLDRNNSNWSQGAKCGAQATGTYLIGAACTSSGATWDQSNAGNCTSAWSSTTNSRGSATVTGTTGNVVFSNGAGMIADIQSWIDNGNAYGWRIRSSAESGTGAAQSFTKTASLSFGFTCKAGFRDTGSTCTTCTTAAQSACVTSRPGNTCNDSGPPSATYTCTCGNAAYTGSGTTSCTDKNECSPTNPCRANGDTSASCADAVAPASGHTCTCSNGFIAAGGSCLGACGGAVDPCGVGVVGACSTSGLPAGSWSCACGPGYVSSGGATPTCVDLDACDASAQSNCATSSADNTCDDQAPPSTTYACTCNDPAYVPGTAGGKPACVNLDECATNNCVNGGDPGAVCVDHAAPALGYDCQCSSPTAWTVATSGEVTCVDTNECAAAVNPCGNGACSNLDDGRGYVCQCDPGYVLDQETTPSPSCIHPDSCNAASDIACVTLAGNQCVNNPAPLVGYTCDCSNPAYIRSSDGRRCVDKNGCVVNHCTDAGDVRAGCADARAPRSGYQCECSPGFADNGTTCVDVNECTVNPCGRGSCTNTRGGYQCNCPAGFTFRKGTCIGSDGVLVTSIPGSCSIGGAGGDGWLLVALLLLGGYAARRRRSPNISG